MSEADCDLDLPPPEDVVVSPRIKRRAPPPPAPLIVMDNLEVRDLGDTEHYDEPPPSSGGSRSIISQVSVSLPPLPDTPKSKVSSFIEALLFKCQLGTDLTIHKLGDTTFRVTEGKKIYLAAAFIILLALLFSIFFILYFSGQPQGLSQGTQTGLLVLGGNDGGHNDTVILITDKGECGGHSLPRLPAGRAGGVAGLVSSGLVILYCGGFDNNNKESDVCWRLRWNESAWEEAPALPQATVYAAQAVLKNKMYVIGGFFIGKYLDTLQVYDGQSWTVSQSRLRAPRFGACALPYAGDYLVLVGGARRLVTPDTAVEVYSATRDRWKALRVQNSFTGAFTPSCVLSGDGGVTVFGGINAEDVRRPAMDSDLHRLRLRCREGPGVVCDEKVSNGGLHLAWQPGVGRVNSRIIVAGGHGDDGPQDGVIGGKAEAGWEAISRMARPRSQAASLVLPSMWRQYAENCAMQ